MTAPDIPRTDMSAALMDLDMTIQKDLADRVAEVHAEEFRTEALGRVLRWARELEAEARRLGALTDGWIVGTGNNAHLCLQIDLSTVSREAARAEAGSFAPRIGGTESPTVFIRPAPSAVPSIVPPAAPPVPPAPVVSAAPAPPIVPPPDMAFGNPWSAAEKQRLAALAREDLPPVQIVAHFPGRSKRAIYHAYAKISKRDTADGGPVAEQTSQDVLADETPDPAVDAAVPAQDTPQVAVPVLHVAEPQPGMAAPPAAATDPDRKGVVPVDRLSAPGPTHSPDPMIPAAERELHARLDLIGNRAPFDPWADLDFITALGRGDKLGQIALDMGIDAQALRARRDALLPVRGIESQAILARVLRARVKEKAA